MKFYNVYHAIFSIQIVYTYNPPLLSAINQPIINKILYKGNISYWNVKLNNLIRSQPIAKPGHRIAHNFINWECRSFPSVSQMNVTGVRVRNTVISSSPDKHLYIVYVIVWWFYVSWLYLMMYQMQMHFYNWAWCN